MRAYLDASAISALFDDRNPERQYLTKAFFDQAETESLFVSAFVLAEIERTPDAGLRDKLSDMASEFDVLPIADDVDELAREYVRAGAVPQAYAEDAYHIAVAVTSGMDFLLSWNYRHLVRRKTRDIVRAVSILRGYREMEIVTPGEFF